ncbi:MarR family winged helix-turn-helix transcriptional regulator [Hyphobacterium sp.]|uniref:MarR family winged helix-turn-helix transcriptional regulator n=1 Tax=Hyphobacterium sp. TaxID=2004662 RepID=UPI003B520265
MDLHDEILIALRRITRAIDLHSRKVLKSSGLTGPQLVVLHALKVNGDLYPSSIARIASLSQATISTILDRLQAQNLVTRERCKEDRRQILVSLTAEAHERLKTAPELLQAGFLRGFARLESWEQLQLLSSLQRLAELMDADDLDAAPILEVGDIEER